MALLKHVGKFGEKPCVIIMRKLPDDAEHCLITQTSALPHSVHDELMSVVQSSEAQKENTLADVLSRRQFSDGEQMLGKLHYNKYIQKVPVNLVMLTPSPSQALPLAEVNAEIDKIDGGYVPPKTDESHISSMNKKAQVPQTSSEQQEQQEEQPTDDRTAEDLLADAQRLEQQAAALMAEAETKKAEAFRLNPALNS